MEPAGFTPCALRRSRRRGRSSTSSGRRRWSACATRSSAARERRHLHHEHPHRRAAGTGLPVPDRPGPHRGVDGSGAARAVGGRRVRARHQWRADPRPLPGGRAAQPRRIHVGRARQRLGPAGIHHGRDNAARRRHWGPSSSSHTGTCRRRSSPSTARAGRGSSPSSPRPPGRNSDPYRETGEGIWPSCAANASWSHIRALPRCGRRRRGRTRRTAPRPCDRSRAGGPSGGERAGAGSLPGAVDDGVRALGHHVVDPVAAVGARVRHAPLPPPRHGRLHHRWPLTTAPRRTDRTQRGRSSPPIAPSAVARAAT